MTDIITEEDIAWAMHYVEYGNDRLKDIVTELITHYQNTRDMLEQAHMAGQINAGVDPSYSEARLYVNALPPTGEAE